MRSLSSNSQSHAMASQPPGRTFSCWGREGGSLTSSAGADPSQPEHPACQVPEGPACPYPCQSAALLGKRDIPRSVWHPQGQHDIPWGHCGHCHSPHARVLGMHSGSTGGDSLHSQPTPMAPFIPGKSKGIPACYPSRFKMLNTEAVKDLGVEKQLP